MRECPWSGPALETKPSIPKEGRARDPGQGCSSAPHTVERAGAVLTALFTQAECGAFRMGNRKAAEKVLTRSHLLDFGFCLSFSRQGDLAAILPPLAWREARSRRGWCTRGGGEREGGS